MAIIGIIVGVLIIIIGFSVQDPAAPSAGIGKNISFGADFYTEIYDVTRDVGYAINYASEGICTAIGWLIVVLGLLDICYFSGKIIECLEEKENMLSDLYNNPSCRNAESMNSSCEDKTIGKTSSTLNNNWICAYCNTVNSTNHAQCKKCGNYRG